MEMEWVDVDWAEVYEFLKNNYVEDKDGLFSFEYSIDMLKWILTPPGFNDNWRVGLKYNGNLVGFISGAPCNVVNEKMVVINFLCVHKLYREKGIAPVMINEITKRVKDCGIQKAIYTAGKIMPNVIASANYYHRSLNTQKLIEAKFTFKHPKLTYKGTIKYYDLPNKITSNLRPLEIKDIPEACILVNKYLQKFELHIQFTEEEFAHWFLPKDNIVYTYYNGTDLVSFYGLVLHVKNNKHKTIKAAYSFYNVASQDLMNDALILAKNLGFDVFNMLDIMDNKKYLSPLKFNPGDGRLNYYSNTASQPTSIGIILL